MGKYSTNNNNFTVLWLSNLLLSCWIVPSVLFSVVVIIKMKHIRKIHITAQFEETSTMCYDFRQLNVLLPNIPHIVLRHHWECRSGSFLIPFWSFWGLIPDLCFDWTTSCVLKHYIHIIWSCCVKRGLKEVHDCWGSSMGFAFDVKEGREFG